MHPEHQISATNHPRALFFCYNRQQKDIVYTNQSLIIFFGSAITDWHELILFRQPEWQTCLSPAMNSTVVFSFQDAIEEKKNQFTCTVTSGKMQHSDSSEPVLFCMVEKQSGNKPADLAAEYEAFVQLAVHDLDAPLRKLTTLIERMSTKIDAAGEAAGYLPRIAANLSDMRAMVDGLSKLSDAYSLTQQQGRTELGTTISQVIEKLREKNTGIQILLEMDPLPALKGDPETYHQLFYQLLENAVKFSKNEPPVSLIVTSAIATAEEKKHFALQNGIIFNKITVRDKGIGFNQADAEKIFHPFIRLHGKSEYPGSGMGLTICKRIVESLGGAIYAEGIENEGAGIILFLPQSLN